MMTTMLAGLKIYLLCAAVFYTLFLCKELFCHKEEFAFSYIMLQKSSQAAYKNNINEEDKALQEAYDLSFVIYKKIVELAALYYCKSMMIEMQILYDKILIDTSKDVFRMIVLLAQYVPLVCKNKKTTWVTKTKKLTGAGCVMMLSVAWLRTFCHDIIQKKKD